MTVSKCDLVRVCCRNLLLFMLLTISNIIRDKRALQICIILFCAGKTPLLLNKRQTHKLNLGGYAMCNVFALCVECEMVMWQSDL